MSKTLLLLFTLVALSALAIGSTTLSLAHSPANPDADGPEKSDQPVTDTWITTKVKAELATTDGVKSMDISVTTVDGVVTLTGVLATDTAVKKAVAATESVKGVRRVDASGLKSKG